MTRLLPLILILAACAQEPTVTPVLETQPCGAVAEEPASGVIVVRVIDGDSLVIGDERVRLLGVDTPEKGEPGFEEAKQFMRDLVEGKRVRLERDPAHDDRDWFGRQLRLVFLPDGRLVQRLLIDAGFSEYVTRWGRVSALEE